MKKNKSTEINSTRMSFLTPSWINTTSASAKIMLVEDDIIYFVDQERFIAEKDEDICPKFSQMEKLSKHAILHMPPLDPTTVDKPSDIDILYNFIILDFYNIEKFAALYGTLGICEHQLPGTHDDCPPEYREVHHWGKSGPVFRCAEKWDNWFRFSEGFLLILRILNSINLNEPIKRYNCCALVDKNLFEFPYKDFEDINDQEFLYPENTDYEIARLLVKQAVDSMISYANLQPAISTTSIGITLDQRPFDIRHHVNGDKRVLFWWPRNSLFRVLVVRLLEVIMQPFTVSDCLYCRRPVVVLSKESARLYHDVCSIAARKEKNNANQKKHRDLKKARQEGDSDSSKD